MATAVSVDPIAQVLSRTATAITGTDISKGTSTGTDPNEHPVFGPICAIATRRLRRVQAQATIAG